MSVPYSVVILGELNVGKSALCRNFFRSGLTGGPEKKRKTVDECGDELFDEPAEESAKNRKYIESRFHATTQAHYESYFKD